MFAAKIKLALALGTAGALIAGPVAAVSSGGSGNPSLAIAMKFPKIPKIPKLPKLPKIPKPGGGNKPSTGSKPSASSSASTGRKEMRRRADLVKAVLAEISSFHSDHRAFVTDEQTAPQKSNAKLEAFRAKMTQTITPDIIRMANNTSNNYAVRAARKADGMATTATRNIESTRLSKIKTGEGHSGLSLARYFAIAFQQEQLKQLKKLYPGRQSIESAITVADAAMAELGSIDQVQADRAEAKAARIAAARLYPARQRNAGLERQFASAFKSSIWTQKEFAGSQILKVNLTGSGWTVRRNSITGIILKRDRQASLGVKTRDGKCYSYLVLFEQKHRGSGYGGAYMASGSEQEMLCKNIPK